MKTEQTRMRTRIRTLFAAIAAWSWLPSLCFVIVPALIIRNQWTVVAADATALRDGSLVGDIRSWWKAACVLGIAAWMICMAVCRAGGGWRPRRKAFAALLAGAALGVLIAAWLSPFPFTRWIGYTGQYEGALALWSYCVAMWYVSETENARERLFLLRSTLVVAGVNIALGILAGAGRDFWQSDRGAWIMGLPREMIIYNFAGSNMASGTAYQPNHYGMLMAMLGALAAGMIFAEQTKLWKSLWGTAAALSLVALLFSRSRAGILVFLFLTLLLFAGKAWGRLRSRCSPARTAPLPARKIAIASGVAALAIAAALLLPGVGEAARLFLERSARPFTDVPRDSDILDVSLADNVISIKTRTGTTALGPLSPTSGASWYAAPAGAGRSLLRFEREEGAFRVADIPGVRAASLRINRSGAVLLRAPDANLEFFAHGGELFAVDQTRRNLRLLREMPPSTHAVNGYEGFLSLRGYIWARLARIWSERPWFGWGPGSVAIVFPNGELLNKQRYSGGDDEDKAHSIPLALLVQLGIVGAALCLLPAGYAAACLMGKGGLSAGLRLPILLGMAAYLLCGLTNDSTAGVTPLFCLLAGLAVNEKTPL